jgi:hypothetical protein
MILQLIYHFQTHNRNYFSLSSDFNYFDQKRVLFMLNNAIANGTQRIWTLGLKFMFFVNLNYVNTEKGISLVR